MGATMTAETLLLTAIGFLLVLLNGFFVAAEFAIVKLRRTQADELAETEGMRGRVLHSVRSNLDAYLSACQLGITLFERLNARLEYERIDSDVVDDADAIWLTGSWRF